MQIIFLILVGYLGWNIVKLLVPKLHKTEHLGLSFLVGMGVYALVYYVLVLYQRLLPIDSYFLILLTLSVVSGVLARLTHAKVKYYVRSPAKLTWLEIVLLTIAGLVFAYIALENWYWPPYTPDAIHLYDFRAQRLLAGDLNGFFNGARYLISKNYPPFTSLLHYFYYAFGYINPKNGYTHLLGFFLLTLYGYMERVTGSRLKAILTTCFIIITPSVWWNSIIALANIPLMEYFALATLYICDFKNEQKVRSSWLLAGILLGISAFIRQEAFWIPILGIALFLTLYTKKYFSYVILVCVTIAIANIWPMSISWTSPVAHLQTESAAVIKMINNVTTNNTLAVESGIVAIKSLWKSWGLVIAVFYLTLILQILFLKIKKISLIQIIGIVMSFSIVLGFMAFAKRYTGWAGLGDAVFRMGVILIPIFWVGIITSSIWSKQLFIKGRIWSNL